MPLTQTLVHPSELADDANNFVKSLPNDRMQGFTLKNPCLIQRYLNEKLRIIVRFRISGFDKEYAACFQRIGGPSNFDCPMGTEHGFLDPRHLFRGHAASFNVLTETEVRKVCANGKQESMLVSIVQLMDRPEVRVPSLVWLDTFDNVNSLLPHACYFPGKRDFVTIGERSLLSDWEASVRRRLLAIADYEGIGQVIECTSEALENIASQERDVRLNDWIILQAVKEEVFISVQLYDDGLWLRTVGGEHIVQFSETLLGPL